MIQIFLLIVIPVMLVSGLYFYVLAIKQNDDRNKNKLKTRAFLILIILDLYVLLLLSAIFTKF